MKIIKVSIIPRNSESKWTAIFDRDEEALSQDFRTNTRQKWNMIPRDLRMKVAIYLRYAPAIQRTISPFP